ncbi:hypothetical protein [Streptomyces sp. NPDC051173]|uniref:hypothetical protein n=1 Tax=Streptomyces sp. NPDC051173 TaxID=3155164 RepID=UPI003450E7E9
MAQRTALLGRFKKLPPIWKAVALVALAVIGFFAAKFILALVASLIMAVLAGLAILLLPLMLIVGLTSGGAKRERDSYETWCEENDGRGRYHSDSGVPF